ncbi:hypothetical protein WCX49_07570 [Sulfurimonas sp. HSL-1656]|uniref:hypothetical protein n=1 Tax=Thiomicrolovo subterrani TaxID=3131934 RepID=UPI0031F8F117
MSRRKKIFLFMIISLASILFINRYGSTIVGRAYLLYEIFTGGGTQEHISDYPKVGQRIRFKQPIGYTVRKFRSNVPIVNEIKNELFIVHPKRGSDALNEYILSDTDFTITDVYTYKDIANPQTYFYVLTDQNNVRYIIQEKHFEWLLKPVYADAKAPVSLFDDLYRNKTSVHMKFTAMKEKNPRLIPEYFSKCEVQDFSILKWEQEALATVDFNQLVCLYQYFWNDFNSKAFPISFEVLEENDT